MAPAWAALAGASSLLYANSTPTPELARTALTPAERAIALDSTRSEGYVALAAYHRLVSRDVRAQQYGWRGDSALARARGDSAAREFAVQVRAVPTDLQRHVLRGLALAYAGKGREALAEAERGLALQAPTAADRESVNYSYFTYVAARTALRAGDRARALAWLAKARRTHYASPAWIRVEPTSAPLRNEPRFLARRSPPRCRLAPRRGGEVELGQA